ncbi:putative geraniol 8-hydroxylase [Helianthus annuus]|nr:putative geraniol 8-hydroxylase [Helianthus annuus]KAJ0946145.1 putative geraniol 8-hydroxylase [Helianthus annuus]KAJ0955235.1 putative geraniol 8-hydroxylase [Helianthus annuus]
MELLLVILILLSIIFVSTLNLHRKSRLPPGPIGFPIIGNLFELSQKPHESLAKLAQKHGPFMTIRLGSITSVVASTPDAARQILQRNDDACSSRPIPQVVTALKHPEAAILWMPPNQTWRTIRKALNIYLTNPHKLDNLSHLRQKVVDQTLEFVKKKEHVDIGKLAFSIALNQMSNTFLSLNVTSYDSDNINGFKTAIETAMEVQGKFNVADIFPVLKPLDPQNIRRQAKAVFGWLDEVIDGFVTERLKGELRFGDMLDSLLEYSRENEDRFNLIHIKALLVDLFIAGTDTTSNIITWAMTELLLNPDMLSRVREEVNQVVGKDGKIKEAEILGLPYLDAVIKETMQLHFPTPLLAPHRTQREVKLGNYIVPTNTQIIVNAWAIAREPSYWESPSLFMPERFLRNEVDYKGQDFEFIPFGSGRRRCPGMALGHRMVSLMVASFVYHFDWKLPHAKDEMDMNDVFGLSLQKATPLVAIPIPLSLK